MEEVGRGEDARNPTKSAAPLFVPLRLMQTSSDEEQPAEPEPEPESEEASLLPISKARLIVKSLLEEEEDDDEEEEEEEHAYESSEKIQIEIEGSDLGSGSGSAPRFSWRKLWLFTGPGFLMSIAFLDPGNLEGDLQSGAIAGYSLLWLLLWATAMGLLIQLLSARLGVATGRHLAELCREEYPDWARIVLWGMTEIALIGADIQEVIGSAIAIKILSRGFLPLWAGVVITALDCFVFLFLENYGVRKLEAVFAVLIATMAISFAWMFGETKPSGKELLVGILVPKLSSNTIRQAVGVVGCVIMPHNVYLHSALVQSRKVNPNNTSQVSEALKYYSIESTIALIISFFINICVTTVFAKGFYGSKQAQYIGLENAGEYLNSKFGGGFLPILYIWGIGLLSAGQSSTITAVSNPIPHIYKIGKMPKVLLHRIQIHVSEALKYYSIESTVALIVSFFINICVMTVFAKGFYNTSEAGYIGLENAEEYLNSKFGGGFLPILYIWGIGLLSAGQSSTITGTYAGQFIMGGFLNLKLKKWVRALITRSSAIIPTLIVALLFGASESALDVLNEWLNVLQSVQIPFALVPLLCLVSKESLMGVFRIGKLMKVVTWTVAALLMIINAYLLLDFVSKEINGLLFGSLISVFILLYAVFILYLILRDTDIPDWLASQTYKRI